MGVGGQHHAPTALPMGKTQYPLCGVYFFIWKKAFDCINHGILLVKLEFYGIRDTAYSLIYLPIQRVLSMLAPKYIIIFLLK